MYVGIELQLEQYRNIRERKRQSVQQRELERERAKILQRLYNPTIISPSNVSEAVEYIAELLHLNPIEARRQWRGPITNMIKVIRSYKIENAWQFWTDYILKYHHHTSPRKLRSVKPLIEYIREHIALGYLASQ